jgi:hypothetical protein
MEFVSTNNITQGRMTRGDILSLFLFDLKKKANMVSTTLCFPIGAITQQNQKSKLDAH